LMYNNEISPTDDMTNPELPKVNKNKKNAKRIQKR
jgi:hypothetical protein